jgi:hypothetical protein
MSDDYEAQYREVARLQYEEIDRLRAVVKQRDAELDTLVAWIASDADAHATLVSVYADPRQSTAHKVRAATSAIGFEMAKPASVVVQLTDFYEQVRTSRLRTIEQDKAEWIAKTKVIEHQPSDTEPAA